MCRVHAPQARLPFWLRRPIREREEVSVNSIFCVPSVADCNAAERERERERERVRLRVREREYACI